MDWARPQNTETVTFGAEVEAGERGSKASEKQGERVAIRCPISWISSDHDNDDEDDEDERATKRRKNKAAKTSRRRDRGGDDEAKARHIRSTQVAKQRQDTDTDTDRHSLIHSLTQRQTTDKTET